MTMLFSIRLHLDLGVPQHRVAELVALRHLAYWRLSGHAIRKMDHCYNLYTISNVGSQLFFERSAATAVSDGTSNLSQWQTGVSRYSWTV